MAFSTVLLYLVLGMKTGNTPQSTLFAFMSQHYFCLNDYFEVDIIIWLEARGSIVVTISVWHTGVPSSIPSHGRHVIFGAKAWLSTVEIVYLS